MVAIKNVKRKGGRSLRETLSRMRPLGPALMILKNGGEQKRRAKEMSTLGVRELGSVETILTETEELCAIYQRLHPEHAYYWQRASELVKAHAQGMHAGLKAVQRWGFVEDEQRSVALPDWWESKVIVPLEFMDYSVEKYSDEAVLHAGAMPERFHDLAQRAADRAWIGYYRAKGCLNSGNVSLLIKDVTEAAIQLKAQVEKPKNGIYIIYVIGISEDEVAALVSPDTCVIGFNRCNSPIIEKLIQSGRITLLVSRGAGGTAQLVYADTQKPFQPEGGKVFLCPGDVKQVLPVADASGISMTNYTLHHNSFADQEIMIRELHRVTLPTKGGGRAWVAGEMIRNVHLIPAMFGPASTVGPMLWDAFVSFVNGVVTVDYHQQRCEAWADEGIHLHFTPVPGFLASAPSFVHWLIMPPTKMLITGY